MAQRLCRASHEKDFQTDQEVRCARGARLRILSAVQAVFPELASRKKISSSSPALLSAASVLHEHLRFPPRFMAVPRVATGLKAIRPTWKFGWPRATVIPFHRRQSHHSHAPPQRRHQSSAFNNKFTASPRPILPDLRTQQESESTPFARWTVLSIPFLGHRLEATFVALRRRLPGTPEGHAEHAAAHKGSAYVEILQNCNIFNDGACST